MRSKVGERIRRTRVERGYTLRGLAELASAVAPRGGISFAYLSRVETGDRQASVPVLRALAHALGVSAYWLEFGTPDPVVVRAEAAEEALALARAENVELREQLREATAALVLDGDGAAR